MSNQPISKAQPQNGDGSFRLAFLAKLLPCFILLGWLGEPLALHAEPIFDSVDLFESGKEGYALYRIPGIVLTTKGSLLAYCEARKTGGSDWGEIDILLRRSTDGGKFWSDAVKISQLEGPHQKNPAAIAQKLVKEGAPEKTFNNPVAIADPIPGVVHFLFCLEYMRCFYCRSDDDGATFSKPVEITAAFDGLRKKYPLQVLATGPGHGLALSSGRLMVPIWASAGTGGHAHRPSVVSSLYSDDRGKVWFTGEIIADEKDPLTNPSETVAAELGDGSVLVNIRSESPANRRAISVSPNGATEWTKPAFQEDLLEPVCMASLCAIPYGKSRPAPNPRSTRLLFCNPHNLESASGKMNPGQGRDRKNLVIKFSPNGGSTWPVSRALYPGLAAYSDIAATHDGQIYVFFERGTADGKAHYRYLTFTRVNFDWLTAKPE